MRRLAQSRTRRREMWWRLADRMSRVMARLTLGDAVCTDSSRLLYPISVPGVSVPRGTPGVSPGVLRRCPGGASVVPRDTHGLLLGYSVGAPGLRQGYLWGAPGVPLGHITGNSGSAKGTKVQGVPRTPGVGYIVGSPSCTPGPQGHPRGTSVENSTTTGGIPTVPGWYHWRAPGGTPRTTPRAPGYAMGISGISRTPREVFGTPGGARGTWEVTWGSAGVPRGFPLVPQRYPRGTLGVLGGHP